MSRTDFCLTLGTFLLLCACGGVAKRAAEDQTPGSGLFFNDGADDDFRGRAENLISLDAVTNGTDDLAAVAAAAPRLLIRRGALTLRTANPDEVAKRATGLVEAAGGYVTRSKDRVTTFRIPAARFAKVVEAIEGLGVVVNRDFETLDVTDKVHDVELRLRSARALRDRYQALLAKAVKVEEMLAIEGELAKVTERIERLEGELARSKRDVAFSLLTLQLQSGPSGRASPDRSPFAWVGEIGADRIPRFRQERVRSSRVRWKLPAGFADMGRVYRTSIAGWAYSPDGIRVVVRRFDHAPRLDRAFWQKEVRREMVEVRGYEPRPLEGVAGLVAFTSAAGDREQVYGIAILAGRRTITTFEVLGPGKVLEAHAAEIASLLRQVNERAR